VLHRRLSSLCVGCGARRFLTSEFSLARGRLALLCCRQSAKPARMRGTHTKVAFLSLSSDTCTPRAMPRIGPSVSVSLARPDCRCPALLPWRQRCQQGNARGTPQQRGGGTHRNGRALQYSLPCPRRCAAWFAVLCPSSQPAVHWRSLPHHNSCGMGHASDHIQYVPRTFHTPRALVIARSTDAACTSTDNSLQRHNGFPQRATEEQSDNKQAQQAGEKKR
jgi:hypothetical protein